MHRAVEIRVTGTVQGVGFRPTVWRLATAEQLVGEVRNDAEGVSIRLGGAPDAIDRFLQRLAGEAPPLARIERIEVRALAHLDAERFQIVDSVAGPARTRVSPDAALCEACEAEIRDPHARRFAHPFANCTHCGPRFSILRALPYDRHNTSMATFAMCEACRREYEDPGDRRFHAQPIACHDCGPTLWLEDWRRPTAARCVGAEALARAAAALRDGQIVAIRGIGGFHLACDATSSAAIERLRERKHRDTKPLALMVAALDDLRRHCHVDALAQQAFADAAAPIVVLQRREVDAGVDPLPDALAPGLDTLGFMRAYTPLHRLLLDALARPLVMTSGNHGGEAQAIGLDEARTRLAAVADLALMHDREIVNRVDDSLVRVVAGRTRVLRRGRGLAPAPLPLAPGFADTPALLAFGADQKAAFCLLDRGTATLAPHQGDLDDLTILDDYQAQLQRHAELYDHEPRLLACDLHPEYRSTKLALALAETRALPLVRVQHHHAHVAACMAEHGLDVDAPPVLGVALDGLGLGDEGAPWGGELLLADYRGYQRLASLLPIALPGGDRAALEPWRNLYAQLQGTLGWAEVQRRFATLAPIRRLAHKPIAALDRMIVQGRCSPLASSTGRLFDAVAAALGLRFDAVDHQAQAAMELEALARRGNRAAAPYPFDRRREGELVRLDPTPMWAALLDDLAREVSPADIAARFHVGLAHALAELAAELAAGRTNSVALTGGCMHNAILLDQLVTRIEAHGLRCLTHAQIPANDGGIALGQALVAAARHLHDAR